MPETLVEDGRFQERALGRHHISHDDLMVNLRLNGNVDDLSKVKLAQLERSGNISVIKNDSG